MLRPMNDADLADIAGIDRCCYAFPWTLGNFSDSLLAGHRCCVYEENGQIFAYSVMMAVVDEVHLLNMTVAPERQGLGYGAALLRRLVACSRQSHFASMWLEVRESNAAAQALYRSAGFVRAGVRKNYYPASNGREDALLMVLDLQHAA